MTPVFEEITTVERLRSAIKEVRMVCIGVRFGISEFQAKISKAEAREFVDSLGNTTPDEMEMSTGWFGFIREDEPGFLVLYLG